MSNCFAVIIFFMILILGFIAYIEMHKKNKKRDFGNLLEYSQEDTDQIEYPEKENTFKKMFENNND